MYRRGTCYLRLRHPNFHLIIHVLRCCLTFYGVLDAWKTRFLSWRWSSSNGAELSTRQPARWERYVRLWSFRGLYAGHALTTKHSKPWWFTRGRAEKRERSNQSSDLLFICSGMDFATFYGSYEQSINQVLETASEPSRLWMFGDQCMTRV